MRRTASSVLRDLEIRVARLEKESLTRTASSMLSVLVNTVGERDTEKLSLKELLSFVKETQKMVGRCVVNISTRGSRTKVHFICGADWSASVDMFDFINAIEKDHPSEMKALMMNADVMDDGDVIGLAYVVEDYLRTSEGSFGGGLGRDWTIKVI